MNERAREHLAAALRLRPELAAGRPWEFAGFKYGEARFDRDSRRPGQFDVMYVRRDPAGEYRVVVDAELAGGG